MIRAWTTSEAIAERQVRIASLIPAPRVLGVSSAGVNVSANPRPKRRAA